MMWTLEQGLEVVRLLQPHSREYNYHIALGGGVVNNGSSEKDLDVYCLPLDNGSRMNPTGLLQYLSSIWGEWLPIQNEHYLGSHNYSHKVKFLGADGGRIDVFIVGQGVNAKAA
jgi:hypothetical protein